MTPKMSGKKWLTSTDLRKQHGGQNMVIYDVFQLKTFVELHKRHTKYVEMMYKAYFCAECCLQPLQL